MNNLPGIVKTLSLALLVTLILLSGCTTTKPVPDAGYVPADLHIKDSAPTVHFDPKDVKPAIPKWEPYSKYGNKPSYKVLGKTYQVLENPQGFKQKGIASWYGVKFHGRRTSSWEVYDMYAMTAAHKSLPIPSYVRVTNLENKQSAIVRVNDRGPFHEGRIIDLSFAAAHVLGVANKGTAQVAIEVISSPKHTATLGQQAQAKPTPEPEVLANELALTETSKVNIKPTAQTNSKVTNKDGNPLYLQVGAFSALGSAQNLQAKLMEIISQPVSISQIEGNSSRLLRVMIGPFQTFEDINPVIALIQSRQLGNPMIKSW